MKYPVEYLEQGRMFYCSVPDEQKVESIKSLLPQPSELKGFVIHAANFEKVNYLI